MSAGRAAGLVDAVRVAVRRVNWARIAFAGTVLLVLGCWRAQVAAYQRAAEFTVALAWSVLVNLLVFAAGRLDQAARRWRQDARFDAEVRALARASAGGRCAHCGARTPQGSVCVRCWGGAGR